MVGLLVAFLDTFLFDTDLPFEGATFFARFFFVSTGERPFLTLAVLLDTFRGELARFFAAASFFCVPAFFVIFIATAFFVIFFATVFFLIEDEVLLLEANICEIFSAAATDAALFPSLAVALLTFDRLLAGAEAAGAGRFLAAAP